MLVQDRQTQPRNGRSAFDSPKFRSPAAAAAGATDGAFAVSQSALD